MIHIKGEGRFAVYDISIHRTCAKLHTCIVVPQFILINITVQQGLHKPPEV
mgnify:CR=1 FL=1